MTPEQEKNLNDLLQWKKLLESSNTIPLNIHQAFTSRFAKALNIVTSAKSSTSENQAVNEGGVATYSVMTTPDGFLQITIGETIYYIPIFT